MGKRRLRDCGIVVGRNGCMNERMDEMDAWMHESMDEGIRPRPHMMRLTFLS